MQTPRPYPGELTLNARAANERAAANNLRDRAQHAMRKLKPETQEAHRAAWSRCEAFVRALVKPGAKVFEVHHAVEHARKTYLENLAAYHAPDHCEKEVLALYPAG